MEDLSLHILDIAENSVDARARQVDIRIEENRRQDRLMLLISDDGQGMSQELRAQALDPFVTTKGRRRVGLGLSLLAQAAEAAGGALSIRSRPARGTRVRATFLLSHIDLKPLGDIAQTLVTLIVGYPHVDFRLAYKADGRKYVFDTEQVRAQLGGLSLTTSHAIAIIKKDINDGIDEIRRFS
jgi:hypothetical protein